MLGQAKLGYLGCEPLLWGGSLHPHLSNSDFFDAQCSYMQHSDHYLSWRVWFVLCVSCVGNPSLHGGKGLPNKCLWLINISVYWHFKVLVLFRTLTSLVQPGFLHVGITWGVVDRVFPREQPQVAFSIGCGRVHSAHGLQGHLLRLRRPPRLRRWQVERGLGRTTLCPFHRSVTYFVAYFSVQLPNPQGCGHEACPWGMGLTCWGFS